MNRLTFLKLFFAFGVFSLFLTSCGDDVDNPIDTTTPPSVKLNEALGYITEDSDVALGESFSVYLSAAKGSNPMYTLTILEDGEKIDITTDRISFDGSVGVANPLLLLQDRVNAFEQRITIKAHPTIEAKTYEFLVTDDKGHSSKVSLIINVVGTRVNTLEGQLLNQSGPAGQGGLDLDTGASTGTLSTNPSSKEAEIRDEGIVDVLNDQTWKQQISGMNGSEIKYIKKGQNGISENFSFDDVLFKEQIVALWGNGVAFTNKSTDGQRDVSEKVQAGDIFIVKNGEKYYLLYTADVVVTTENNNDYYLFDVKL
ncbi:MAG: hypothetical protein LC107_01805 [Chitinophagales bacterium]|nr:hypothetical protein [Chitinophagales bacterium]